MNKLRGLKIPIKESYLLIIIIVGILSLCMYSSFALFSLEKTTKNDIVTMTAASDIQTNLSIYEYQKISVGAGENQTLTVNVTNDTGGSIYYGIFYEMLSPSTKSSDITIAKIDWSANATSGSITNGSKLPVELVIINNSSSEITLNIGVAGSDSNELGLTSGKELIIDTFNTGTTPSGDNTVEKTTVADYSYTGAVQTATLKAGTHKLEVWGAQGGGKQNNSSLDTANGGMGGYSYGTLTLTSNTNVFIYAGGMGKSIGSGLAEGGFNGGGAAYGSSTSEPANGGGGASDIRINEDSLYSRVIVAGGGGGGGEDASDTPGYGGGTSGGASSGMSTLATQTSTGTGGVFGLGANTPNDGGGGGGGWYGGGTTNGSQTVPTSNSGSDTSGGAGGSGYVYASSTASNYPTGVKLTSTYYLTNASTVAGNTSFTDNSGSTVTGHSGNGFVRITSTIKEDVTPAIDTTSAVVKPGTNTSFKDIVTCEDKGSGCKILFTKPSNSKNLASEKTYTVTYVIEDNNGNRYKYTKNVEITSALRGNIVKAIAGANDGSTGDSGSGVYKVHHDAIASKSSAMHVTISEKDDYRYYGANPNNYVCLDMAGKSTCPTNNLFRMIGVVVDEGYNKPVVKIIKPSFINGVVSNSSTSSSSNATKSSSRAVAQTKQYAFSWYTGTTSTNLWAPITSDTLSRSNDGNQIGNILRLGTGGSKEVSYYNGSITKNLNFSSIAMTANARSVIDPVIYFLGGYPNDTSSSSYYHLDGDTLYKYERGIARASTKHPLTWLGFIGLMYPSDLAYAAGKTCSTFTISSSSNTPITASSSSTETASPTRAKCASKDWLYSGYSEWLMMPSSNSTTYVYSIGSGPNATTNFAKHFSMDAVATTKEIYIRPVMHIKPTVSIVSGQGTQSSPYVLSAS